MLRSRRESAARAVKSAKAKGPAGRAANDDANDDSDANDDAHVKPLKDADLYVYSRVPFGFPPWYLDAKAESSAHVWDKMADRFRTVSARAANMNLAIARMRGMKHPVRRVGHDHVPFLQKKMADAGDALKSFSDLRKGSPATVTEKPLQLLTCAEDSLWMALTCLCRMLEAKLPRDANNPDGEWEWRLRKLMEMVAVL